MEKPLYTCLESTPMISASNDSASRRDNSDFPIPVAPTKANKIGIPAI
jgi:hypothetical protein